MITTSGQMIPIIKQSVTAVKISVIFQEVHLTCLQFLIETSFLFFVTALVKFCLFEMFIKKTPGKEIQIHMKAVELQ